MKYLILMVLTVALILPASASDAPIITSWGNDKTDDNRLDLTIDVNDIVKFNATANQTVTWLWTLNGIEQTDTFDNITLTFNNVGDYKVGVNGTNNSKTTQTTVWNVTVEDEELEEEEPGMENGTVLSWSPQVVDYVYVNDTVDETINYWIITDETMTTVSWTVDGVDVDGSEEGNNYSYEHTWDNNSIGSHTVIFKGNNSDSQVEFRWYVNVLNMTDYEAGDYYSNRNIFDIMDDALENHVTDVKIRMFKYRAAKHGHEYAAQKVNRLHDEIAKRQMTRDALRQEFKAGEIDSEQYVAALKQAQRDAKYNKKLAQELAKAMSNTELSSELAEIPETDENVPKGKPDNKGKGQNKAK